MSAFLDKLLAVIRRDLLTALRYRRAYFLAWAGIALELATFYYLARAVGPTFRPEGMDYYAFLLAGSALCTFLLIGVNAFVEAVRDAQLSGTMEVLMNANTNPSVTIVLSACSLIAGRLLHSLAYLVLGLLLFKVPLQSPNLVGCAVVLLLSTILVIAIGVFGAALQIWLQRGTLLVWFLGAAASLLTGAMFPVSALPHWLQLVSRAVPVTYALSAFRLALLKQASFAELAYPLGMLALFTIVLLPLSLALFSASIRRARHEGSLGWY